jgi:putative RNA 2'-phosphotransferase
MEHKNISKLLSLVLRHQPEAINIQLDEHGWVNCDVLIQQLKQKGHDVNMNLLEQVVNNNDKKRFVFNENITKIRANQGHSIAVDVELKIEIPPAILYHGTAEKFVPNILKDGITKQQRQYVHLSEKLDTAIAVGARHGKPIVFTINTAAMQNDGYIFYLSVNNVWLINEVPPLYISL